MPDFMAKKDLSGVKPEKNEKNQPETRISARRRTPRLHRRPKHAQRNRRFVHILNNIP
jgi:mitochondrial fission protein ELM1